MMNVIDVPEKFSLTESGVYASCFLMYKSKRGRQYCCHSYCTDTEIPTFYRNYFYQANKSDLEYIARDKTIKTKEFKNSPVSGIVLREVNKNGNVVLYDPRGFNIEVDPAWFTKYLLPNINIENGVIEEDLIYCMSDQGSALTLSVYGKERTKDIILRFSDLKKSEVYLYGPVCDEVVYLGRINHRGLESWKNQKGHCFLNLNERKLQFYYRFPGSWKVEYSRPLDESDKTLIEIAKESYNKYYKSTSPNNKACSIILPSTDEIPEDERQYYSFYKYLPSGKVLEARSDLTWGKESWSYYVYTINNGNLEVEQVTSFFIEHPSDWGYNRIAKCSWEEIREIKVEWNNTKKTFKNMPAWVYRENSDFMVEMKDGRNLIYSHRDIVI